MNFHSLFLIFFALSFKASAKIDNDSLLRNPFVEKYIFIPALTLPEPYPIPYQ